MAVRGARELPLLRGRTVVPEVLDGPLVLGHPNHLGRFEDAPDASTLWIPGPWAGLLPLPRYAQTAESAGVAPLEGVGEHVQRARLLAKRLRQAPGVDLVALPDTPVIVVLTSFNPPERLDSIEGVCRLGPRFQELPGGVRIELSLDVTGHRFDRYAAAVVAALTEES